MDMTNMDFILDVFKTLTNELPDQLLYREDGDSMELKTLDGAGSCLTPEMLGSGWSLIGSRIAEAA